MSCRFLDQNFQHVSHTLCWSDSVGNVSIRVLQIALHIFRDDELGDNKNVRRRRLAT